MKKVLAIFCATVLSTTMFAQSGKIFVGGNVGFYTSGTTTEIGSVSTTRPQGSLFNIGVEGHYMLNDRFAVGLGLGYDYSSSFKSYAGPSQDVKLYDKTSLFTVAPSLIYFLPITEKLSYTPKFYVGLGFGANTDDSWVSGLQTSSENLFDMKIGLSLLSFNYKFNDNLALNVAVGDLYYNLETVSDNNHSVSTNSFNLSLNRGMTVTLRWFF